MSTTPEEFIKQIRAAKTPNQEQAIIETELSIIRSQFKQRDQQYAARNVAKIVYASMCGFSVTWGDMEIVNLCQSAKNHSEKRLAYLALQIVPHDDTTYLSMATNTIKSDLESGSQYHASLALRALAAVGTPEMLVELSPTIQSLIKDMDSVYIRKQAMIVGLKIVKLNPEIGKVFIEPCIASLSDKSNSIPLAGVQLAIQLVQNVPDALQSFLSAIPRAVTLIQELQRRQISSEHEMGGINDPVLQVQLLRLIRLLLEKTGASDKFPIDQVRDCLLQVITMPGKKGESTSARASIQIETALALLAIPEQPEGTPGAEIVQECWSSAVEALVSALGHKNQSVRYAALAAAADAVRRAGCSHGVQRYQDIVFQCMQEESLSLRRKALNLLVLVAQKETAMQLVSLLIGLIAKEIERPETQCKRYVLIKNALNLDIKSEIISSVCFLTEVFCEDVKQHFEVLLAAAYLTGQQKLNNQISNQLINHFLREKEVKDFAVSEVEAVLTEVNNDISLLYNETLICSILYLAGEVVTVLKIPESLLKIANQIHARGVVESNVELRYAVAAVAKLFISATQNVTLQQEAASVLQIIAGNCNMEIQRRAVEYAAAAIKHAGLLGAVPPTPKAQKHIKIVSYNRIKPTQQLLPANSPSNQVIQAGIGVGAQKTQGMEIQGNQRVPGASGASAALQAQGIQSAAQGAAGVPGTVEISGFPTTSETSKAPGLPAAWGAAAQSLTAAQNLPGVQNRDTPTTQNFPNQLGSAAAAPLAPTGTAAGDQSLDALFDSIAASQTVQKQPSMLQIDHKNIFQDDKISILVSGSVKDSNATYQFFFSAISDVEIKIKALYATAKNSKADIKQLSHDILNQNKPPATQTVHIEGENKAIRIKIDYIEKSGAPFSKIIDFDPEK